MEETYAGSLWRLLRGYRVRSRGAAPAGKLRKTVRGKRQPRGAASSATCTTFRRRCTRQDRLSYSHSRSSGLKLPVTVSSALMTDDRKVLPAARAGIVRAVPAEAGPPRCCSGACLRAHTRPRLWLHFLWPAAGSHRCAGSRYPARPPGPCSPARKSERLPAWITARYGSELQRFPPRARLMRPPSRTSPRGRRVAGGLNPAAIGGTDARWCADG
jgi:hypothetical protein